MTDAEIIKSLECCFAKNIVCKECPYCGSYNCPQNLGKDTIDLINRQKAEVERLQKELEEAAVTIHDAAKRYSEYKKLIQCQKEEIERLQSILLKFVREINIFENKHNIDTSDFSLIPILENEKNSIVKQIKSEARKEFAERLKDHKYQSSDWSHGEHPFVIEETDIDDLVEEMEGD